ncbi:MAG: C40 family peptidase [Desulfovibrio sp.]|uniref:C40 family peptidase n=1 Tax=Desulfovibrio sp. TaxID=885 RepID=UPI002582569E|nr:C40 family peptidase [Desulfovibrio sp.]MCD7984932.1 C40 family peptidase [Desulfovibrio sp.]
MGKYLKICALIMGCGLAFGCATKQNSTNDDQLRVERFRRSYEAALDEDQAQASRQLLRKARSAIGTPYVRGGSSPGGFDCSGFVCWAYKSVGVDLPRTAREQSVVGERIKNQEDMRAGDIVAFRHPRRGYHTGIYVGDGKFIHSPRRRTTVRINSLSDPYFSSTFLGARRVNFEGNENLVAQAESRLSDYAEEKAVRELSASKKSPVKSRRAVKTRRASRDKVVQVASSDTRRHAKLSGERKTAPVKAARAEKSKAAQSAKNSKSTVSNAAEKKSSGKALSSSHQKNKKTSGAKNRKKS